MTRKVLFFDIDGTLWNRLEGIQDDTLEALRKVRAKGHLIFINTGRSMGHVTDEKLLSAGWDGFVAGCGTYASAGSAILRDEVLETGELERIINEARAHKVRIILEGRDCLYFDDEEFAGDPYGEILIKEVGRNRATIKDNWLKWRAAKFSVDIDDPELGQIWLSKIAQNYNPISHNTSVYEVVPKGFSKATGMKEVMDYLGMDMKDSIAFGDSSNDLEMLEAAGTTVVMGQAPEALKAIADLVTTGPSDGGIKLALERLGLI